ncbi:cofactor-independent phosphoglycerate mutase [Candidatus Margulisiibacteriota bacterium]
MKYLVLIGDGMSDFPGKQNSALKIAKTPNLDYLAQNGLCGWVSNIPPGMAPGSDVAAMSILGVDPKKYYTGRGPLEAVSLGVNLKKGEVCFRCNLVSVKEERMHSFTANHISTKAAKQAIKKLNQELKHYGCKFHPGLSYRHLLVAKDKSLVKVKTTPPHDISGKKIAPYLPKNKFLKKIMEESRVILKGYPKASQVWLWGQGFSPSFKKFPKRGAMITAVHLLKGLAKAIGLKSIDVPGATGYLDTNYEGKANWAIKALKTKDIVFVHVESPDEAGHEGNFKHKVKAIEDFDKKVVGTILRKINNQKLKIKILILPDHPTPVSLMTHTSDPVPFVIYDNQKPRKGMLAYNEKAYKKAKLKVKRGHDLLKKHLLHI